jgi:hypothetical protein
MPSPENKKSGAAFCFCQLNKNSSYIFLFVKSILSGVEFANTQKELYHIQSFKSTTIFNYFQTQKELYHIQSFKSNHSILAWS